MNNKIYKRVVEEALYMKKTKCTIRELAKITRMSKSTVHKDLHDRLRYINNSLFLEIEEILNYHSEIKHINGGQATKMKYLKRKG